MLYWLRLLKLLFFLSQEVAAVLIAFEFHEKWQSTDVKLR